MHPLKFKPILKEKVWGGGRIAAFKGAEPDAKPIGESWELSGYQGSETVAIGGEFDGRGINSLVGQFKGELVGEGVYAQFGDEFPILIKFIDAAHDLSIQVHPDDATARRHNGPDAKGKTEMWYVLDSDPAACITCGLKTRISRGELIARIGNGTISDVLAKHDAKEGDVFFLRPGIIHAIGAGTLLIEIQQTSDTTYRMYDYGRLGLDGKPRELHIEKAADAVDYTPGNAHTEKYGHKEGGETILAHCPFFTAGLYELETPLYKDLSGLDSFVALVCIHGSGTITDREPSGPGTITIRKGETVLIPASSRGMEITPGGDGLKLISAYIAP